MIGEVYQVHITSAAETDLYEIAAYLAYTRREPGSAHKFLLTIREQAEALSESPGRRKRVDEEPWRTLGFHRIRAKNWYIYYRVIEEKKQVDITGICYIRKDQETFLNQMDIES